MTPAGCWCRVGVLGDESRVALAQVDHLKAIEPAKYCRLFALKLSMIAARRSAVRAGNSRPCAPEPKTLAFGESAMAAL
jgi:hypothetical protein